MQRLAIILPESFFNAPGCLVQSFLSQNERYRDFDVTLYGGHAKAEACSLCRAARISERALRREWYDAILLHEDARYLAPLRRVCPYSRLILWQDARLRRVCLTDADRNDPLLLYTYWRYLLTFEP